MRLWLSGGWITPTKGTSSRIHITITLGNSTYSISSSIFCVDRTANVTTVWWDGMHHFRVWSNVCQHICTALGRMEWKWSENQFAKWVCSFHWWVSISMSASTPPPSDKSMMDYGSHLERICQCVCVIIMLTAVDYPRGSLGRCDSQLEAGTSSPFRLKAQLLKRPFPKSSELKTKPSIWIIYTNFLGFNSFYSVSYIQPNKQMNVNTVSSRQLLGSLRPKVHTGEKPFEWFLNGNRFAWCQIAAIWKDLNTKSKSLSSAEIVSSSKSPFFLIIQLKCFFPEILIELFNWTSREFLRKIAVKKFHCFALKTQLSQLSWRQNDKFSLRKYRAVCPNRLTNSTASNRMAFIPFR